MSAPDDPSDGAPDWLDDPIFDDLFHGCALAAWLDQAAEEGGFPNEDATKRRAYRYYEEALATKDRTR